MIIENKVGFKVGIRKGRTTGIIKKRKWDIKWVKEKVEEQVY